MEKNQNVRRLTINPTADYNKYVDAIQASGIDANWHEKMFLQTPQNLEAMSLAYKLSRDEISHYFKHSIEESPLTKATLDPAFQYFSEENQQAIKDYVSSSLETAKYQYYPEAYGAGCPATPTFKIAIPFSHEENSEISVILNPYMDMYSSSESASAPVSSNDEPDLSL